jgi:hypothetical protein
VALEISGALGLLFMFWVVVKNWSDLPEVIPSHFGASGKPDGWSGKSGLWILPAIGVLIYIGLTVLSKYPHIYNYAWPITPENARTQYRLSRQMIVVLKTEIVLIFAYIVWQTVQTALGKAGGLGGAFMPVFLLLIFGSIGWHLFKAYQAR